MKYQSQDVTAVILAGGKGRRMEGANKGLMRLNQKPLIAYALDRITPQSHSQIISANQNLEEYQQFQRQVVSDHESDFQGPLSGLLSCKNKILTDLVLSIPCDTPFIPDNLLAKMLNTYNEGAYDICVVHDGQQMQNLFLLFPASLLEQLQDFFQQGNRRVSDWIKQNVYQCVDFSNQQECFININTLDSLNHIQDALKSSKS